MFPGCQQENEEAGTTHCLSFCSALHEGAVNTHMPKPKKPRRRKDTLVYMSALQMMEGLSLIEEQGNTSNSDHVFLADLLQKAEEAGEDGVVGVSKTVADVTTGCLDGRIGRGYRKEPEGWCFDVHYHIMQDQTSITLRPAVAHLNREASRRRRLLWLLLLSTRGHGR